MEKAKNTLTKSIKGIIIFIEWGIWATLTVQDDNRDVHKIGMSTHQFHRYDYQVGEIIHAEFEYGEGWSIKRKRK